MLSPLRGRHLGASLPRQPPQVLRCARCAASFLPAPCCAHRRGAALFLSFFLSPRCSTSPRDLFCSAVRTTALGLFWYVPHPPKTKPAHIAASSSQPQPHSAQPGDGAGGRGSSAKRVTAPTRHAWIERSRPGLGIARTASSTCARQITRSRARTHDNRARGKRL